MRNLKIALFMLFAVSLVACGGSSGGETAATTRTMSGAIQGAAAMTIDSTKLAGETAGACGEFDPPICRVIATATDGTTVLDENLTDCAFSLALLIGNDYVISFVGTNPVSGECDTFVATLLAGSGSLFNIDAGTAIDLGTITIDPATDTATFSGSFTDVLGCEEIGFDDRDDDGACDGWDGSFPDDPTDFEAIDCTADTDCPEGETCGEFGFCSGEGTVGGEEPPAAAYTIADLPGTYNAVGQLGDASCDNTYDSLPHKEIVTPTTDTSVSLEGEADGAVCWHELITVPLTATATGFEATGVVMGDCGGCPLYANTSSFTFDTSLTTITLTRIVTDYLGADLKEGCGVVYEKE